MGGGGGGRRITSIHCKTRRNCWGWLLASEQRKYGENLQDEVGFIRNGLDVKPEWQALFMLFWNGFEPFTTVSFTTPLTWAKVLKFEVRLEQESRKLYHFIDSGLVSMLCGYWVVCRCPVPRREKVGDTGLSSTCASSFIPGSCGAQEPSIAIEAVKNPWKLWKVPGHPRNTVTCLIPHFYLGDEAVALWNHFCIQAWIFNLCSPWSTGWASYGFITLEGLYILLINLNSMLQNLNLKSFSIPLFMV